LKFLPPAIPAVFLVLLLVFLPLSRDVSGEPVLPVPGGAVNDFAGIIPVPDRVSMERLAGELLSKTGTALVVATVFSTEGRDPDEYANQLYEAWGIGKKGEDRGVLMFLALKEKRIRIETGYGMEGLLPDGLVGSLLDTYVLPDLRRGAYGPGLLNGMKALAAIIARDAGVTLSPESAPVPARNPQKRKGGSLPSVLFFLLVLFLLLGTRQGRAMLPYILLLALSGGGRGSSGGGFGSFGGGFGGFGGGMSGGGGAGRSF